MDLLYSILCYLYEAMLNPKLAIPISKLISSQLKYFPEINAIIFTCCFMAVAPFLKELHPFLDILDGRTIDAVNSASTEQAIFEDQVGCL